MGEEARLRVLHVILVLGETNGQYNEHCLPLARERDISICTYFPPELVAPDEIRVFSGDGTPRGFFAALRRALDAGDYDVIHCHAPESALLVVTALVTWRRYGRVRPSLVYTVQDSFNDYKLRNQAIMAALLPSFARVIFCSRAAYDSLPRPIRWSIRGRWRVIPNAADTDRVDRAIEGAARSRGDASFTLLSVGRLHPVKDPEALLASFTAVAGSRDRLVFVGAGPLRDDLERVAVDARVTGKVGFTGAIARDEVFVRCAEADVFVSTSRGEGLPVAVLEAMTSRCPVILSDIPPHRELADGADFIPLVAAGDVAGFAREIRRYREMPPEKRREIGHRCREHVLERFTLKVMHAGTEQVYRDLARRREDVAVRAP